MRKIADADELERELRKLLAYAQSERPSRARMASALEQLSHSLTASDDFDTKMKMWTDKAVDYHDKWLDAAKRKDGSAADKWWGKHLGAKKAIDALIEMKSED